MKLLSLQAEVERKQTGSVVQRAKVVGQGTSGSQAAQSRQRRQGWTP